MPALRAEIGRVGLAALGAAFSFISTDAMAGAWTQDKGRGLLITTVTVSRATDGFNDFGAVVDTPKFAKEAPHRAAAHALHASSSRSAGREGVRPRRGRDRVALRAL